jgi:hypothetical protein
LLLKREIIRKRDVNALRLVLMTQKIDKPLEEISSFLPGTFGYVELFADEIYEWSFNGKKARFRLIEKIQDQVEKTIDSDLQYFYYPQHRNILAQKKLTPVKAAILIDVENEIEPAPKEGGSVRIEGTGSSALYSALIAQWGAGKKKANGLTIQVKEPYDNAKGDLHLYSDVIPLDDLSKLKPRAYHLFCTSRASYNGYVRFAQSVTDNMVQKKMPVETAYLEALRALKGKEAKTKPPYYLYRN